MENKEKQKQSRGNNKLDQTEQKAKKEPTVKSEKIRYKNADTIYDL